MKKNIKLYQLAILLGLIIISTSCTFLRTFFNAFPNSKDSAVFPSIPLPASSYCANWASYDVTKLYYVDTTCYQMIHSDKNIDEEIENIVKLDSFLLHNKTTAFMIIENDKIILEKYYHGHDTSTPFQVFSVSKSVVATVVGLAIEDGYIHSIYDSMVTYLPNIHRSLYPIRLIDLLDMRSGIDDSFTLTAELYYGINLNRIVKKAKLNRPIGSTFQYSNWSTQQLMFIVEAATGRPFIQYFQQRLWDPLGTEYSGSWTLDSKKDSVVRAFAGLSITARDLAKFGLAYLNNGVYAGKQIIPTSWVEETMTLHNMDTTLFSGIDNDFPYNMHWRLIRDKEVISAVGLLGQFLYIDKRNNRIVIRIGDAPGNVDWIKFFESSLFTSNAIESIN